MKALITGATKGIGRAIATILAENGVSLTLNARNKDDLQQMLSAFNKSYPKIKIDIFAADLSNKAACLKLADFALAQDDTIDVLINNAGIFLPGETHKEEPGSLEKMIETNLYSAYYLSQPIAADMIERGTGHIFNMCSIASKIAYPNGGSYSISKFALLGFTKVLREELKDKGIKVTAILPGATWSNSWAGVDLPKERLMEARDIAISVWSAIQMSPSAVVEEITIRPQLGDL